MAPAVDIRLLAIARSLTAIAASALATAESPDYSAFTSAPPTSLAGLSANDLDCSRDSPGYSGLSNLLVGFWAPLYSSILFCALSAAASADSQQASLNASALNLSESISADVCSISGVISSEARINQIYVLYF